MPCYVHTCFNTALPTAGASSMCTAVRSTYRTEMPRPPLRLRIHNTHTQNSNSVAIYLIPVMSISSVSTLKLLILHSCQVKPSLQDPLKQKQESLSSVVRVPLHITCHMGSFRHAVLLSSFLPKVPTIFPPPDWPSCCIITSGAPGSSEKET